MRKLSIALTTLAATALALTWAAPAAAQPSDDERVPAAHLTMTMTSAATSASAGPLQLVLECGPDGGTHPTPQAACDSLRAVNGDFAELPPLPGWACLDVYEPVDVRVEGHWARHHPDHPGLAGQRVEVEFERTYSNACYAFVYSDGVFDFAGNRG